MIPGNKNEALVCEFFATLGTGDFAKLKTLLDPDATWTVMPIAVPGSGAHHGPKGIVDDFLVPLRATLFEPNSMRGAMNSLLSKGSLVAAETQAFGRLQNGKDYHNYYVFMFEVIDNKIAAVREYMDSHYVMESLDT